MKKINLDKVGMTASAICGIHCIALPFVFIIIPYASIAFLEGSLFEWGFILFSLIIASFAMIQGFLAHKKWLPLILASIGFFIFISTKTSDGHSHETFSGSLIFALAGALICCAHFFNHKFSKLANCNCSH
jgi:hypothetical protein